MLLQNSRLRRAAAAVAVLCFASGIQASPLPPWLPPPADHSGCGKQYAPGYHGPFDIVSGNLTRNYTVQVPKYYNGYREWPVIFDYHGNTDNSTDQRNNSAYFKYTNEYLVVYPQGYEDHWEGPLYAVPGVNDTLFTSDLLARIRTEYCVDSDRVYASGKSNGAGFVDTLACSNAGDEFAAFAMASAALYTDLNLTACGDKKRAILESHGDKDTTIPYHPTVAGKGGPLPDITDWVHWWGERDCGLNAKPTYYTHENGYNITTYSCLGFRDVVQHYQVFQLGHCWPSSTGENFDAITNLAQNCSKVRVLDYTPVVLDFFGNWDLRKATRLQLFPPHLQLD